jgi:hypothetical protein
MAIEDASRPLSRELGAAQFAALTTRAVSDPANALIDRFLHIVTDHEQRQGKRHYKRGKKQQRDFRRALEGLIGDLLRACCSETARGWVYRSTRPAGFTGDDVSFRTFQRLIKELSELGLIERRVGFQDWTTGFDPAGPKIPTSRKHATRYRATKTLLDLSVDEGVEPAQFAVHFVVGLPKKPLQLRASSTRNQYGAKVRGAAMKFARTAKAERLEREVRELNEFFDTFDLRGGVHRGFIRIFNKGNDPKFNWNKGGRLYRSPGENNYQQMDKCDRLQMTIEGEQVCEIDIRASYLTIFHALYSAPFDPSSDPYDLPGLKEPPTSPHSREFKRDVVKLWFVATFGNEGHLTRWPREIIKQYRGDGYELGKLYPVKRIREAATEAFPMLDLWGAKGHNVDWSDLMFLESEAVIQTMRHLMNDHKVPSLSVYDSLIVPGSKAQLAEAALRDHYRNVTGVAPQLVLHQTPKLPCHPKIPTFGVTDL